MTTFKSAKVLATLEDVYLQESKTFGKCVIYQATANVQMIVNNEIIEIRYDNCNHNLSADLTIADDHDFSVCSHYESELYDLYTSDIHDFADDEELYQDEIDELISGVNKRFRTAGISYRAKNINDLVELYEFLHDFGPTLNECLDDNHSSADTDDYVKITDMNQARLVVSREIYEECKHLENENFMICEEDAKNLED